MEPSDYRVIGVGCDVSSELSVQQAFRRVMDTYGRVDSVVASAGASYIPTLFRSLLPLTFCRSAPQASSRTTPPSSASRVVFALPLQWV